MWTTCKYWLILRPHCTGKVFCNFCFLLFNSTFVAVDLTMNIASKCKPVAILARFVSGILQSLWFRTCLKLHLTSATIIALGSKVRWNHCWFTLTGLHFCPARAGQNCDSKDSIIAAITAPHLQWIKLKTHKMVSDANQLQIQRLFIKLLLFGQSLLKGHS